jgi:hypothetical protein
MEPTDEVAPRVRRALYAFLLAFVMCGVLHLELWPFTGFRLFSELRPAERQSWELEAVDPAGTEHPIVLHDLPVAYRNTSKLLLGFPHRSTESRDAVCDAWVAPLEAKGQAVADVHVYEVTASVRPHGPPPHRRLAYRCGSGS